MNRLGGGLLWKDVEGAPYDDSKKTIVVPKRKKYSREDLLRWKPEVADVPEPLKRRELREIVVMG